MTAQNDSSRIAQGTVVYLAARLLHTTSSLGPYDAVEVTVTVREPGALTDLDAGGRLLLSAVVSAGQPGGEQDWQTSLDLPDYTRLGDLERALAHTGFVWPLTDAARPAWHHATDGRWTLHLTRPSRVAVPW